METNEIQDKKEPFDELAKTSDAKFTKIAQESGKYVVSIWDDYQISTAPFRNKISEYYKQYRGIPNRKNYQGLANVVVNETLEATESIVAQIFHTIYEDPKRLLVVGREQTDDARAMLLGNLMQNYLDKMSDKPKVLRFIRQMVKYGTAFAKICWCYEEKDKMSRTKNGIAGTKSVKSCPDLQYIDLLDIAVDPGKASIEDMDWVIIRKRVTWDYIRDRQKRGLYSKHQVDKIVRSETAGIENQKNSKLSSVGINYALFDKNIYEIYEYWGKVPRWWIDDSVDMDSPDGGDLVEAVVEVTEKGLTLRCDKNPYWHQEKPILMAHYLQVDDEAFGMGTCEISEYLQQELNDKRNQALDWTTEQIAPPLVINRGANIAKKDITLTPFKLIDSDLPGESAISPMRLGGNAGANMQMDGTIKQDIRNQTGATNAVQGISSNKETTAFEVNTLEKRGGSRINVVTIDFAEKFLKRFYRLTHQLLEQYVTKEEAIRIVGKQGVRWEKVTPEDVHGNFDFIPKISTDYDSRSIMRQQMIQFVTQLGPLYPEINVYRLVRKVYELFGYDDVDQVVPRPDTEKHQEQLTIEEELQVLTQGQKLPVAFHEDHMNKVEIYTQYYNQNLQRLSPKARGAFQDAIVQHMGYLKVLQQAQMDMGAMPAGQEAPTGPTPNGGSPVVAPVQSAVDQSAQEKRNLTSVR